MELLTPSLGLIFWTLVGIVFLIGLAVRLIKSQRKNDEDEGYRK